VENIVEFVDELEKLVPVEIACQQLAVLEIEDVDDEQSLIALQEASDGTDKALSQAVREKIELFAGKMSTVKIRSI
jgi:hypothetical protein